MGERPSPMSGSSEDRLSGARDEAIGPEINPLLHQAGAPARDLPTGDVPARDLGEPAIDQLAAEEEKKPPEQIEQDIERTRAHLSETLDALERKLAPRQLLEQGIDMLRGTMTGNSSQITDTIRNNPMPLALIGVGVGWLLLSGTGDGRRGGSLSDGRRSGLTRQLSGAVSSMADTVSSTAHAAVESVKGMIGGQEQDRYAAGADPAYARTKSGSHGGSAYAGGGSGDISGAGTFGQGDSRSEASLGGGAQALAERARATGSDVARQAGEYASTATERARDLAGYAGDQVRTTSDRMSQVMQEHPLVVGGLALLAGAVLGLVLPSTEVEKEVLGETGEAVKGRVVEEGREVLSRAAAVAERVAEATTEVVREEVGGKQSEDNAGKKTAGSTAST